MRQLTFLLALLAIFGWPALADSVTIEATGDATLIEDPGGAWANGSGPFVFVGRTSQMQNGIRRGLLRFDVASALPAGAVIESASLTVVSSGNMQRRELSLHRLLADWGEGPSFASGGGGAPSQPGDATWLHTFYDGRFWPRPGGQFVLRASASRDVGTSGIYTFESTDGLVRDVRLWSSAPHRNFGWIVIGDETTRQSAKKIASRESADPLVRPQLTITYRPRGRPAGD